MRLDGLAEPKKLHMDEGDHSMAVCYKHITKLTEAFSYLSSIQQIATISPMSQELSRVREDLEEIIATTACEIYTALTGVDMSVHDTLKKMDEL